MLAMYMALIEECDKEKFERLYYTYNKMMFESAKALIISMVKNKARNNLKAEHYDKVEPMDENQIPDTVMSDISSALRYKELIEMVNTLEQQYREVLVMRLVNGLSVNEISEKLDLPYRTVETRIFRARKKLKDRLKEMYDE